METVPQWAEQRGYAYRFYDDSFFDRVPAWFRERVRQLILPMSDLARLLVARELLDAGFDRVIWVDADVLIFNMERFEVDVAGNCAFCRELWLGEAGDGTMQIYTRVNNAVTMFMRDSKLLDFYIEAVQAFTRHKPGRINRADLGTVFLSRLHALAHFPLLSNVGMISPWLLADIANGQGDLVRRYMEHVKMPVYAANLCGSLLGAGTNEADIEKVVDILLATQGEALNQYVACFEHRR